MSDNNLDIKELSAEEIAKAESKTTLTHGVIFEGGTSYMDDALEIPEPETEGIIENSVPAPPSPDGLDFISVPDISDDEDLPPQPREDRGLYDPFALKRPAKKRPASDYDLDNIAVPQISDDEDLPPQPPEDRGNSTGDPFAVKRQPKKKKAPEDYDLVHIAVPEISDDEDLPLSDAPDDDMEFFHHKKAAAPQNYDLEQIDVPQFSDSEALPDIGPVFVKPEEIKKPKPRRRYDDDFPMPVKAVPTGGHTGSYSAPNTDNLYRPTATPAPKPVPKAVPSPAPKPAVPKDDGFPQPIKAVPPAPKPSAPAAVKEEPASGGFFKKIFGKK